MERQSVPHRAFLTDGGTASGSKIASTGIADKRLTASRVVFCLPSFPYPLRFFRDRVHFAFGKVREAGSSEPVLTSRLTAISSMACMSGIDKT